MTLQSDFREVTDRIIAARRALMVAEAERLTARSNVEIMSARLDTARRALMGRSDAGSNEAQRRAYAERETVSERDDLAFAESDLAVAELAANRAALELRCAEDERRYLELVARLTIAGVGDDEATENGDGRYTLDAANRDLF